MFKTLARMFCGFKMPEPAGPPRKLGMLGPGEAPIAKEAAWSGGEVRVTAAEAGVVRLFEFPLEHEEQCRLTCSFKLSSQGVAKDVYPEIWVRVDGFGECFSKGLNYKLRGTNDWTSCELPFYLKNGQRADLIKLNLVFGSPGAAALKDIEMHSTPLHDE